MKRQRTIWLAVVGVVLLAAPALAQRGKRKAAGPTVFSTQINNAAPGIDAVLALTAEQNTKIAAARKETLGTDAVVAALKTRNDANAAADQKKQARKTVQDAEAKFGQKVAALLTPEQKALYDKINAAFAEVRKAAGRAGQGEAATARQERQAKIKAEFGKKLDGMLTAEQKAAMAKAASATKGARRRGAGGATATQPNAGEG